MRDLKKMRPGLLKRDFFELSGRNGHFLRKEANRSGAGDP